MTRTFEKPSETAKSTAVIGFKLLNAFCGGDDNLCISPLSIGIALQMLLCGASGNTAQELLRALDIRCPGRDDLVQDYCNAMNAMLNGPAKTDFNGPGAKVQFAIANSLWAQERVALHPGFVDYLQKYYAAEARSMNFADPATLATINAWVANKTNRRIPHLLDRLNPQGVLVLVNCAFFKARWAHTFTEVATRLRDFFTEYQGAVQVHMMTMRIELPYYRDQFCEIAELDYTDKRFRMYVILPAEGTSLKHFTASFSYEQFSRAILALRVHIGQFTMPRFKFEFGTDLTSSLQQLGIVDAFSDRADFWNMLSPNHPDLPFFTVNAVAHKTFIELNEEGTEAAAATATEMFGGVFKIPQPPPPFSMLVDRPFLFVIEERESGAILFLGRVTDPRNPGS